MDFKRKTTYPISDFIVNRWSARAMNGEEITDQELFSLFEAARWAPSSYNNQPWRFIYGKRKTAHFETLFKLLTKSNQAWAKQAAVLVVMISKKTFDYNGKPSKTHSFDTGAAWENLALEGSKKGLVVHGMEGFSYRRAKKVLSIPDNYQVEAMVAIGKKGMKESLPEELQKREFPSDRKPLKSLIWEGKFLG